MPTPSGFTPRKLIAPLIIIGVAVALGVWGSQTGSERNDMVERYVRRLLSQVASGEDTEILLARTNSTVAVSVRRQLALLSETHDDQVAFVDIDVFPGDINPHPGSETATHSVLIGDGKIPMLGLRIFCKDDANSIRILGWWNPQAN